MKTRRTPEDVVWNCLRSRQQWFSRNDAALLLKAILFIAVLWGFLPAINNAFIGYDDPLYVTENGHVQQGVTWQSIGWALASTEAANWHPLTWISHILDCQLYGVQAWGHHLTSLILHAMSTVLLFTLLKKATDGPIRSFVVALFFGLHPLRVESVAWVAERKDVLSTLFWVLTLHSYVAYVKSKAQVPQTTDSRVGLKYALTLVLFALGLMSKPMVVTLPFVLLLLDFWPLKRIRLASLGESGMTMRAVVREKIPFFLLAGCMCIVTFLAQRAGGAIVSELTLAARVENALISYCRYLGKLFWPTELAAFYPPINHWGWESVAGAALLLACITIVAVVLRRNQPWVLVGWCWFVGTLVPVIGFVPAGEQSMADRYTYIPSIGVLVAVVWGAAELINKFSMRAEGRYAVVAGLLATSSIATSLVVCSTLTRKQTNYWRDTETLFRHAIEVTSNNYVAHNNVGTALERQGRAAEAILEFQEALRAKPNYAEAYDNLGVALGEAGRPQEALDSYTRAVQLKPEYADPHNNSGTVLEKLGRFDEAIREYKTALRIRPDYADAHNNLGTVFGQQGRFDEAITEFREVLRLQPYSADAHNNLGVALEAKGQVNLAIAEFKQAVRLDRNYARAHFNLGSALAKVGQLDASLDELQRALNLKSDYTAAQTNLAAVREMKKRASQR